MYYILFPLHYNITNALFQEHSGKVVPNRNKTFLKYCLLQITFYIYSSSVADLEDVRSYTSSLFLNIL